MYDKIQLGKKSKAQSDPAWSDEVRLVLNFPPN